jgi:hypothetical protein
MPAAPRILFWHSAWFALRLESRIPKLLKIASGFVPGSKAKTALHLPTALHQLQAGHKKPARFFRSAPAFLIRPS